MKPILVPTDFSRCAQNAIDYAVSIATKTKAEIILLHVGREINDIDDISEARSFPFGDTETREQMELIIEHQRFIHSDFPEMEIHYVLKQGDVVDETIRTSAEKKAGLVVMGTQGATKLSTYLLGSNTANVINKSNIPVLAIPQSAKYIRFDKIALATDLHEMDDYSVFDPLIEIALLFSSKVEIITVHQTDADMLHYYELFEKVDIDKMFRKMNIPYEFQKVVNSNIAEGVHNFVKNSDADLLVTIPQKHNFLALLFNTSLTRELVFHNDIPVLALPDANNKSI